MRIIGIAGPAGSGKSTAARNLCATDPTKFVQASFAYPIKLMMEAGLGVAMDADKTAEWAPGVTVRRMYQTLGTEWGRRLINPDVWIWDFVRRHGDEKRIIVVDDIRMDNEADLCRRHGAIVHLMRGEWTRSHSSENGIEITGDDYSTTETDAEHMLAIVEDLWEDREKLEGMLS